MKTTDLPRKPRPAHSSFPFFAAAPVVADTPRRTGDWRYAPRPKNRGALVVAVATAAAVHAAMFYGFSEKPHRPISAAPAKAASVIQIAMPPLPPEPDEEQQPRELVDESAAVALPQLADVPTSVALSDFAQSLDLRPRAEVDVGALKSMTIPVARGAGGLSGGGAPTIFSLSQLDRVPQPIAQPMPSFPRNVRLVGVEQVVVVVEFIVDAEGQVIQPRVTQSNAAEFNSAALVGVLRWKFRPGVLAGRKVATRMEVPLKFDLKTGE